MSIKQIFVDNKLSSQQATYTCGPCSVLNILQLKGDSRFNEMQLAQLSSATPDVGISNEDLVELIKHVGLTLIEEKADASIQDIEEHLDKGAQVVVNYIDAFSTKGHYAVVTEHDDEAIYMRDSSLGMLRLSKDLFGRYWHNSDSTIFGWYAAVA